jgi:DNA-binding transcriptional MerR regulator
MPEQMTLAELSEASGVPARTIRFYIARGLVEGPSKAGRGASYTGAHVERIEQIKKWQSEGRMLSDIGREFDDRTTEIQPVPWLQYQIADGIVVHVRADTGPWRTKEIREAIKELARRLAPKREECDE